MPHTPSVINTDNMVTSIKRSGYLIEQRVERIFSEYTYHVITNPAYKDFFTSKSREYDIFAITALFLDIDYNNIIFPVVLCECMNNYQPLVFFIKEEPIDSSTFVDELKCSGIPVKFLQKNEIIGLSEFILLNKYHHYSKGPFASQYCTFTKKNTNSPWIAFHGEEHDGFNSLIQAIEQEIEEHYEIWTLQGVDNKEYVNLQIYHPLIILQGELYGCFIEKGEISLRDLNHLQFRKRVIKYGSNKAETYQIDVIKEEYLPEYLNILKYEYKIIKKYFKRKKHIVTKSIQKIITEAIALEEKPRSYRSFFEMKK